MSVRTWKKIESPVNTLSFTKQGIRYDAGSWIAEILDDEWMSYTVVKREKISDTIWKEWLAVDDVPRLPRDAFSVESFQYIGTPTSVTMESGWAWTQELPHLKDQPPSQAQQPRQQPTQQYPSQRLHPKDQRSSHPMRQTSQQYSRQGHAHGSSQPVQNSYRTSNMKRPHASNQTSHAQPQLLNQVTQAPHSLQHTQVPSPPHPIQAGNQVQSWTPLEQFQRQIPQYHRPTSSSQDPKVNQPSLPRSRGRPQGREQRAQKGSYPKGNEQQLPVACHIVD